MTYPKQFTEKILELEAHGFTAEETREYLQGHGYPRTGIATVYRHRKGSLADEITAETVRQQRRSILKHEEDRPELSMKYRNELLKLLIPQRIEALSYQKIEENVTVNVTENEDEILSKAAAILSRKDRFNKIH